MLVVWASGRFLGEAPIASEACGDGKAYSKAPRYPVKAYLSQRYPCVDWSLSHSSKSPSQLYHPCLAGKSESASPLFTSRQQALSKEVVRGLGRGRGIRNAVAL